MSIPEKAFRAGSKSVSFPDLLAESDDNREELVRKDLTLRLKRVCEHLSAADFELLLVKMIRQQLKGEGIHDRKLRPH